MSTVTVNGVITHFGFDDEPDIVMNTYPHKTQSSFNACVGGFLKVIQSFKAPNISQPKENEVYRVLPRKPRRYQEIQF